MSKKFRLLMVLVLVTGLFGGLLTGSTVSADPSVGEIVEIPRIDVGNGWDTQIQIQNVSGAATTVTVEFWPAWSATCPPQSDTSLGTRLMVLPADSVWTLHSAIPAGAQSAIVTTDPAANLAVTVDRWGTSIGAFQISSSYTGVTDPNMVGNDFEYFAPYIMHGYHDLDTVLTIQNSGDACTSVWIYYKQQGNCECMKAQHIELIRPGESIRIGPGFGADVAFPGGDAPAGCSPGNLDWVGSAFIAANEELAIVVDQLSITGLDRATLLSMRGLPYDQVEERVWYADLLYREISGWDSAIQVQNLTRSSMPTFVTVEFFDQSGDSILFVGDWVCRNGAKTFYLPAITDLGVNYPFGYVGAAEIMSHQQVDYPGDHHKTGEPIFAVVDLKKVKVYDDSLPGWRHTVAGETQGGAYNAHPEHQKENANGWAMPYIAKEQEGVTSRIAIRNNSNCNKISGKIWIRDETGTAVGVIDVPWLQPKHMKIIDLAYFGNIARGFVGAGTFMVGAWNAAEEWDMNLGIEQLCDIDGDGITDLAPVMPSIVVLNYGFAAELPIGFGAGPLTDLGDLTRVYEAYPYIFDPIDCYGDVKGNAYSDLGFDSDDPSSDPFPLEGVKVEVGDEFDMTDSTGWYRIEGLEEGLDVSIMASKSGFATCTDAVDVPCNDQVYWNPELRCQNINWTILVTQEDGASPVYGADVTVTFDIADGVCVDDKDINDMTNSDGEAVFSLADTAGTGEAALQLKAGEGVEVVITKDGYDTKTVDEGDGIFSLDDFDQCPATAPLAEYKIELCGYFSIYGVVKDAADNPHNGYTVQAETENTGTVLGFGMSDTCCSGNYALSGSIAECTATGESGMFYLRTYAPNGVLVNESALYTCDADGVLGVQCGEVQKADIVF